MPSIEPACTYNSTFIGALCAALIPLHELSSIAANAFVEFESFFENGILEITQNNKQKIRHTHTNSQPFVWQSALNKYIDNKSKSTLPSCSQIQINSTKSKFDLWNCSLFSSLTFSPIELIEIKLKTRPNSLSMCTFEIPSALKIACTNSFNLFK